MMLMSDDVVVNDEWIIPSTFLQQTVKKLGVIFEAQLYSFIWSIAICKLND